MRKLIVVLMLASIAFVSCKKSSTKVAFTNAKVKPLFDAKCKSCHGKGTSAQGSWLYDASDYDACIKAYKSKLYETVYSRKSMPQGSSLSQTELSDFKAWYDGGCMSN